MNVDQKIMVDSQNRVQVHYYIAKHTPSISVSYQLRCFNVYWDALAVQ